MYLGACISGSGTIFGWLHDVQHTHVYGVVILLAQLVQYVQNSSEKEFNDSS